MTHDEMIAVISAHKEGKPIEQRLFVGVSWHVIKPNPDGTPWHNFDFAEFEYRLMAQPREWWILPATNENAFGQDYILNYCPINQKYIHVREVLE